ncbi:MAG: hypothetical protein H6834_05765 [Planctomycetes bacterium]|nr:hypothetical protein [Planctomycetota bacterium]MCB9890900.1 hypothetical protein [Planctomycetota bacterium]
MSISRLLVLALTVGSFSHCLSAQGVLLPGGTPDPAHPDLHAWYDAANGPNGSATPLPHGTSVTQWNDLSTNAFDLTRVSTDPAKLPTSADDVASCGPAIRFDGNDYVWTAAGDPFGRIVGARTIFCVGSTDTADAGYLYDGATTSGRTALFAGQSSNPNDWQVFYSQLTPSGSNLLTGGAIEGGRSQIHTVVLDANQQEYFVDGTLVGSDTNAVGGDLGGFIVGARVNTANGLRGYVREILIYHTALSAADRQAIEGYLLRRHPRGYGQVYGAGCAGSGGFVPALSVRGCPGPGRSFDVVVDQALGGAPCTYVFGLNQINIPLGPCTLLVDPFVLMVPTATSGSGAGMGQAVLNVTIPPGTPAGNVTCQAFVLDPLAAPFGVAASNGLLMVAQ